MAKKKFVPVEFSPEVRRALQVTANQIFPDAGELCEDNEEFAEMVLDANRVSFAGFKDEEKVLDAMIAEHGYERVLKSAAGLLNYI